MCKANYAYYVKGKMSGRPAHTTALCKQLSGYKGIIANRERGDAQKDLDIRF